MILLTAEEMQKADSKAIDLGMPELILMETAGRSVAARAYSLCQERDLEDVVILVGGGNNGGDGLVAARYLYSWGIEVKCLLKSEPESMTGVNSQNLRLCQLSKVPLLQVNELSPEQLNNMIHRTDLLIDALLGTGLEGPVRGTAAELIELANNSQAVRLSVDIPSGVNASTGEVPGVAVRADITITMQNAKLGQALYPGRSYCGDLTVTDLGFPAGVYDKISPRHYRLTDREARELLPPRPETGHKGTFGSIMIVSGSRRMPGAAVLTALSALRGGAGLVRLAAPEEVCNAVPASAPEVVLEPLPTEREGRIDASCVEDLISKAESVETLALGPGIGQSDDGEKIVGEILKEYKGSLILDADGLNNLSGLELLDKFQGELVLTPHPGEMGRLKDKDPSEIVNNRVSMARDFARKHGAVLHLKGAASLTALPAGEIFVNPTGNSGMGTAGSGDVLTGLISGLVAQGLSGEKAACLAAYIHGRAGDLAAGSETGYSLTAGDVLNYIGPAFKSLFEQETSSGKKS